MSVRFAKFYSPNAFKLNSFQLHLVLNYTLLLKPLYLLSFRLACLYLTFAAHVLE